MGELVRQHLYHASWFTAHLTFYTADFGTTEGRGCGQGEAEDRPRAGIVEFAYSQRNAFRNSRNSSPTKGKPWSLSRSTIKLTALSAEIRLKKEAKTSTHRELGPRRPNPLTAAS